MALSAYIGDDSEFDKAIAQFAMAYADQTERDWSAFLSAIKAGRISAGNLKLIRDGSTDANITVVLEMM